MKRYEYKSVNFGNKLKNQYLNELDKTLNEAGAKGWELVATTPVSNSFWTDGKTTHIVLTFRREVVG